MKLNLNLEKTKPKGANINYHFDKNINYYICSSGGCGSTILSQYLSNFGNVYHIHDRYPPDKLCYVGRENTNEEVYSEWFNNVEIPEDKLHLYKVIFIYRNPIDVIFSRFIQPQSPNIPHLQNIKCINNGLIGLGDLLNTGRDLYGLEEFYDNYTIPKKRNYQIYCIKYEYFFYNIELLNKILGIPDIKSLYPIKRERTKTYTYLRELSLIYQNLIIKMKKMPFIKIISPIKEEISNDDDDV
jgi:hypothetical protein